VYLHNYQSAGEAEAGLGQYSDFYSTHRPHQALGYRTPAEVHLADEAGGGSLAPTAYSVATAPPKEPEILV
jgi:hypothetical protein